jgi:hypothetical protein
LLPVKGVDPFDLDAQARAKEERNLARERDTAQWDSDIQELVKHEWGRRIAHVVTMEEGLLFRQCPSPVAEGSRRVGLAFARAIKKVAPQAFALMWAENERNRNEHGRAKPENRTRS